MISTASSFEGRVAVVTGGASGIGAATVLALAARGADVAIVDLAAPPEALMQKLEGAAGRINTYQTDVTSHSAAADTVYRIVQEMGRLDILVHSAGVGIEKDFLETSPEEWNRIISVDLTGTFNFCQAAAKEMAAAGYGRIVTIASTAGIRGGYGRAAYGAAKGGVITLTKVMAVELAAHGITVNTLAPGAIDTELVSRMHSADTRRIYTRAIPAKRYGTPEETAAAAVFLASEEASYINGHVMSVDGGFLAAGLMRDEE